MSTQNVADSIHSALSATVNSDFAASSRQLLAALGYFSDRVPADQRAAVQDFIAHYPAPNPGTDSEQRFVDSAQSVNILMQFTDAEIASATQRVLFDADAFSTGNAQSFLFIAVELRENAYPRGRYVEFTREINKRLAMPAVMLFRTAARRVTLAFVHRRPNKRDPQRDVLGTVSLIREIDAASPHRAHLDILDDLSLPKRLLWMDKHGKSHNFDGLLAAWLDALDTEELNRRFYGDLFNWFQRAVAAAKFPTNERVTLSYEEHVIRLITRLLFVWFIKEKGLVDDDLFVENRVGQLLKGYDAGTGDAYYRTVLQNLFFATLNTEIDRRGFSSGNDSTHREFSRYRYRKEMVDPDGLLKLFEQTPFINGGLFDCLDTEEATSQGGYRVDCFSDVHFGKVSIPNRLFFSDSQNAPGLITLFNRYKFTVEENTPAEREVALDPELLGKVFENLLAVFNPETRENARKQTGSFYTPRTVVDYMVDEALVAALAQKAAPADGEGDVWQERLRDLLDYDVADAETLFGVEEKAAIVRAIAGTKVLDPAVGSGAFPMGVLHKLTLALRRLDPKNELWAELQREQARQRAVSAFETDDQSTRDAELEEISDTFQRYRDSDFGRKLYLIQNGIYGVDIQPIATQIAKLRFFISLAIDQEPTDDADDNYGIKPLPNLETRFVAADSLLGIAQPAQPALTQANNIAELHGQIRANRERHFHAKTREQKQGYRNEDQRLRRGLALELQKVGFSADPATQIADWDPYDQNSTAGWFDAEYMFGVTGGFDVVIGNPPYVELQKNGGELRQRYQDSGYETIASRGDVYQLFYEKGCQLLAPRQGMLAYITSNSWLKAEYGKSTRRYFAENHTALSLLDMGKDVFDNSIVDSCVLVLREGKREADVQPIIAVDMDRFKGSVFPPEPERWGVAYAERDDPWSIRSPMEQTVFDKMLTKGTTLGDWNVSINRGITTGFNEAFLIDADTRAALVAADQQSAEIIRPALRGRNIRRFQAEWQNLWLIIAKFGSYQTLPKQYPAVYEYLCQYEQQLRARGQCRYSRAKKSVANPDYDGQHHWLELDNNPKDGYLEKFAKEKLVWMDLTERGRFAYDAGGMFCVNTVFVLTGHSIKYLCGVLNSTLITWFMGNTALSSGMGVTRWIGHTVEQIPVPELTSAKQYPIVRLVDCILDAKADDADADTAKLEAEIDRLVYGLYGLTEEEIAAVEGR